MGAIVYGTDPVVTDTAEFDLTPVDLDGIQDLALDGVVLVTAHPEFETIDWDAFDHLVVVDGRNALDLSDTDHCVYTIGRGVTN